MSLDRKKREIHNIEYWLKIGDKDFKNLIPDENIISTRARTSVFF